VTLRDWTTLTLCTGLAVACLSVVYLRLEAL
jgi:hypothetical protein